MRWLCWLGLHKMKFDPKINKETWTSRNNVGMSYRDPKTDDYSYIRNYQTGECIVCGAIVKRYLE